MLTLVMRLLCAVLIVMSMYGIDVRAQPFDESNSGLPVLRSPAEVRALSDEEARRGYPVDFEAVVTYVEIWNYLFAQSGDEGVFVSLLDGAEVPAAGDRVRIRGFTGPGSLNAVVRDAQAVRLGDAPFPDGSVESIIHAHSWREDSRWIGVEGAVRRVVEEAEYGRVYLEIFDNESEIRGYVQGTPADELRAAFAHSVVRFFGACGTLNDENEVPIGAVLLSPSIEHVSVIRSREESGVMNVADIKKTEIVDGSEHQLPTLFRVKARATIDPAGRRLYLEDETGGSFLDVPEYSVLPTVAQSSLEVRVWRTRQEPNWVTLFDGFTESQSDFEPNVVNVTAEGLQDGIHDAQRVRIHARYFRTEVRFDWTEVEFRSGNGFITALIPRQAGRVEPIVPRSLVEISGIKAVDDTGSGNPRLLVAALDQIQVVSGPSWWSPRRIVALGGGVVCAFGLGMAWVITLKRRVILQTREIRSRLHAEMALEHKFRDLVDNASDMIFTVDRSGRFLSFNAAGAAMVGRSVDELRELEFNEVVGPDKADLLERIFDRETETGEDLRKEVEFVHSSGARVTVELSFRLMAENGRISGAQGIGRDVSARIMAEEVLRDAKEKADEANRLKSEFLAMMSHEIRTPMNGVMGMTDLLLESELDDDQRELATLARSSAESLLRIINDILDFSKLEAGKLELASEEFDVAKLVEETCELLAERAHRKGVRVHCHVDPNITGEVTGDGNRLRQVLVNLVGNAIKFTEQGSVEVEVGLKNRADGRCVVAFEVRDTGVGIDAKDQARLFEPFSQVDGSSKRRFEGTGLGLIISRRIVNAMGGDIHLRSQPGKGSTFSFEVNVACAEVVAGPEPRLDEQMLVLIDSRSPFLAESIRDRLAQWLRIERLDSFDERTLGGGIQRVILLLDQGSGWTPGPAFKSFIDSGGVVKIVRMLPFAAFDRKAIDSNETVLTTPLRQEAVLSLVTPEKVVRLDIENSMDRDCSAVAVPVGGKRRALVAEDNKVNRQLARRHLEKLGFQVTAVENGLHAVEAVRQDHYDIVFMDWFMPEMDGIEATRIIRSDPASKKLKIVAMTANALVGDREKCLEAGMDDYLSKPIHVDRLRQVISDHIR